VYINFFIYKAYQIGGFNKNQKFEIKEINQ